MNRVQNNKIVSIASTKEVGDTKPGKQFFEIFWTVTDLAEHLKVSPKTIYDWVHRRVIPFHKLRGRLVRFRPSEIEKWLSNEGGHNVDYKDP
jgi:excisionase family DNA binding protein